MASTSPTAPASITHHRVRTFFAAVLGSLALSLVITTVLDVWLNRTLTDTDTYVHTVMPLAAEPAVQSFVAGKLVDQLLSQADPTAAAQQLLPADQVAGRTPDQLADEVRAYLNSQIVSILTSSQFTDLWVNANRSAQTQLVQQLSSNSSDLTLDLHPALIGATNLIVNLPLGPKLADGLNNVPSDQDVLNLKGGSIDRAHQYYRWFKLSTWTLVIITLLLMVAAAIISTHHIKTIRRMLVGTAVLMLLLAAVLQAPSVVKPKGLDPQTLGLAKAIAHVLFHNLQVAAIVIAIICLVAAVGTKVYQRVRH